jgi:hypothetical protein
VRRLRTLSEAECYVRCYGAKDGLVRLVDVEPRAVRARGRRRPAMSGEDVRRIFEGRFEAILETA